MKTTTAVPKKADSTAVKPAEKDYTKLWQALREKWRPFCPQVDESVMSRLKGRKELWHDSPFSPLNVHGSISFKHLRALCDEAAQDMQNTVMHMCEGKARAASDPKITYVEPAQALKDMRDEQEAALILLKDVQKQKLYKNGTVFDTTAGGVKMIYLPSVPGGDVTVTTQPGKKFTWKHYFVVLDNEVKPLVKFPDASKE